MKNLKIPANTKRKAILSSPEVIEEIRGICQKPAEKPIGPYGIPIVTADWLEPDEYFIGDSEVIQKIMRLAEKFGPEFARKILKELSGPDTP